MYHRNIFKDLDLNQYVLYNCIRLEESGRHMTFTFTNFSSVNCLVSLCCQKRKRNKKNQEIHRKRRYEYHHISQKPLLKELFL